MEATRYISQEQARALIYNEGQAHTVVVRFVKNDGTERRMVCRYYGNASSAKHLIKVWDMERGAYRNISLSRVISVTPCHKPKQTSEQILDGLRDKLIARGRKSQRQSWEAIRDEMHELF